MTKTYVIISDTQLPYEDRKALKALVRFIGEYDPDEVVHIGDLMDYPQPSRWSKGTAAEFEGSVFEDSEYCQSKFLAPLREAYGGPIGVIEGNHDLRPRSYLSKYAPALAESGEFNLDVLLDFEKHDIQTLPDFYEFAPGWVMTHGHLGNIRLTTTGNSALNAAKKMGVSIIMGHTHRLQLAWDAGGYGGEVVRSVAGFEVGNLMNQKLAGYLNGGTGNWRQGFGIVHVDGKHVHPQPVPIDNNRFIVDGVTYSVA